MTLRETALRVLRLPSAIPSRSKIGAAAAKLAAEVAAVDHGTLAELDAKALKEKFQAAIRAGRWDTIDVRDWRQVPWIAFESSDPLTENGPFLAELLRRFRVRRRRGSCRTMIAVYLKHFRPRQQGIVALGEELSEAVMQWEWPWRDRHKSFGLFDPEQGPKKVAEYAMAGNENPFDRLETVGLIGSLKTSEFAATAYAIAIGNTAQRLFGPVPSLAPISRLLAWSATNGRLLYDRHRAILADALLQPWSAGRDPTEEIRDEITRFLLTHLKDPRTAPGNWAIVSDEAKQVMRRWLTRAALEQFIEVIDHFAVEHMWRFRRAFWMAYFEKGVITDAKVLFGPNALNYARTAFESGQTFGTLDRLGVDPNQSVLLLKIDKLTIADWSHNGKCHIWNDGNPRAPILWPNPPRRLYTKDELRAGSDNEGVAHIAAAHGNWQAKIADYIRHHTGISISARSYMPRD